MIKIHQFSPSAIKGDGIGNGLFYLQKILTDLGFVSHIYAENIEDTIKDKVLSYKKIDKKDTTQILLIHYSIYYNFSKWIDKLNLQKIMVYHNITPYHFFKKGTVLYKLCKRGVEYLPELSTKVDGAIGISNLNSKELKEHNFKNISTIPLLVDTNKILDAKWDYNLFDTISEDFTIIFIGRIAKNKAQHDIIEIANVYRKIYADFKLYIIGSTTDYPYYQSLQKLIDKYDLEDNVILTGKVTDEELFAYYRGADVFLCMSEHEGFGIPLIESMLFNLPVIAYDSSNIKDTLNGGGVLFTKKSYPHIASTIELIRTNKPFRRAILETQKRAIESYRDKNIVASLVKYLNSIGVDVKLPNIEDKIESIKFQFEGPFDSSYSLAILNRYSALAFEEKYPNQVSLFATEGGGDYIANEKFLKQNPQILEMNQSSKKGLNAKVVFRNLYPPRVSGMRGDLNILNSYGWEESAFPLEYVENFNAHLDGITVMSNYVKDVLRNNGVKIPIKVVGLGVEHILKATPKPFKLKTNKSFKFLHISSCFPRKGVDTLLKAYVDSFTIDDDVTLIIKTFPNPHNSIENDIKEIQKNQNAPEIILINQDLEDEHISWLYQNSNVLVMPSRGEGFGLPMAEAMLFNLPVVTTAFGGQSDFCNNDTAWLIAYSFQEAKTHLNLFNSYWAEPKLEDLKRLLKEQVTLTKEEKKQKTQKAYNLISTKFRWQEYREKTEEFLEELKKEPIFIKDKINLGWVSSYNTKCGIATYSEFLLDNFSSRYNTTIFANYTEAPVDIEKEDGVIRCWNNRDDKDNKSLIKNILRKNISTVVINFNFGFFDIENLGDIIESLKEKSIKITIIFHSVADITKKGSEASLKDIKSTLRLVDNLLVHTISDLNFFKEMNLLNISLLPHGVINRDIDISQKKITTISSYGFFLPHKGLLELIEAFAILEKSFPYLRLLLVNAIYPVIESQEYYELCQARVEELNLSTKIEIEPNFLTDSDSFKLLDKSNLLVLPYRKTQESASGAIRYALATKKPVLCTSQPIFSDVSKIVHFTDGFLPQDIADKIKELIANQDELYSKNKKQQDWIVEHDWHNITKKLQYFIK